MFDFFKRNKHKENPKETVHNDHVQELYAISDGEMVKLEDVSDPMFQEKMLGDGYALKASQGKVYAPINGEIKTIFPTEHGMGITTESGLEFLIHLGFDTVELEGKPFEHHVHEGQVIAQGDLLTEVDLEAIRQAGKDDTFVVICTNMQDVANLTITSQGQVKHDEVVGQISAD
ncbi:MULTISPECIES: PTS glucose transporter subunit IIA [Aerococcus]|uniref:PTS glucose transporter subunit IIA n=1 Tax=Aerococcus sanguinicola TaxID=119206 RepID=A0A5N1GPZ2_9LACT|nr:MULTISPECIES: PTS glucose transporter subunit IIA [Aerococcus]KAA9302288.1 PTS glucose transporter subunit IIA [Aerococcus sanguinicola]MDK6369042.1 PTS glucose transporter subunit IIA [Aerococcus sp. UMB9870]MDK6678944.1 PTS glucose transporter subunit IIA [Aerococcus sp. UMB8608]MDK6686535.1 PTS glucose transporter subunit IIA [Aerococcus sp. UMB8623]MDK6939603.1 PTS glucose transporter subunit IIA [Aerococcus sp. UMB8487]